MDKTYAVYGGTQHGQEIKGENLIAAIENSFESPVAPLYMGNVAGYVLNEVYAEFDPTACGGKGGVKLTISAYSSDGLVNYGYNTDTPKY